jgi:hypothetical protein
MALLSIFPTTTTPTATNTHVSPSERRVQLEQIVSDHAALQAEVTRAQIAFEYHDRILRDRYLHPTGLAEIGIEDDAEEQRRRSLRHSLGQAQLTLADFEKQHELPVVQAELTDLIANADAREGMAARRKLIDLMLTFEADILRAGSERLAEINRLGDEIEDRWPGQRLTTDLPHMPPGVFTPDGLRSIVIWFREVLCAAQLDLFEPDDPVRVKIEQMKRDRTLAIWHPLPPTWR